jgi:hypothetical protein
MARFSLCLAVAAAAACCCLALLLPPVQGRRPGTGTGTGRDHRLLFPEPRLDAEKVSRLLSRSIVFSCK